MFVPLAVPSPPRVHAACTFPVHERLRGSREKGWVCMHRCVELVSIVASTKISLFPWPRWEQNSQSEVCRINLPCVLHFSRYRLPLGKKQDPGKGDTGLIARAPMGCIFEGRQI